MVGVRVAAAFGVAACCLALSSPAAAQGGDAPLAPGPFATGSVRLSLTAGAAWSGSDTYLVLGVGAGYFFVDGLEAGLDYEAWVAGSPTLQRLSPEVRYVFYFVPTVKPYLGTFYRHTFVSGFDDFDQIGVRGGIYFVPQGGHLYGGGGLVYERVLDCTSSVVVDCDSVYPELFLGIAF